MAGSGLIDMATLIDTPTWLAEHEARHLFLTDRRTGLTACMQGPLMREVRDCLRTHGPDRVAETYKRLADYAGCEWLPVYKEVPRHGAMF